jgi:hypothetical protein
MKTATPFTERRHSWEFAQLALSTAGLTALGAFIGSGLAALLPSAWPLVLLLLAGLLLALFVFLLLFVLVLLALVAHGILLDLWLGTARAISLRR